MQNYAIHDPMFHLHYVKGKNIYLRYCYLGIADEWQTVKEISLLE